MQEAGILSAPRPQSLVGTWRRFGPVGPVYEVVAVGAGTAADDQIMRVRIVETGEEIDYRLSEILHDPVDASCSPSPSI